MIVLASSSVYRAELLKRLNLEFTTARPDIDESPLPGELPIALAMRLAEAKAAALAKRFPQALIIGSDQVACLGNTTFGKPGSRPAAITQLQQLQGQQVLFHTAVCLLDSATGKADCQLESTEVHFRHLSGDEIERYVDIEQPFDCAGSAKSEGLGISLLEKMPGNDPTALIGLPLIRLAQMLRNKGLQVP